MSLVTPHRARTTLATAALGIALTTGLAACGDDEPADSTPKASATEHNRADVDFATGMIPHHAQALSMVDMTRGRDLDPEVEQLVEDIRDAQAPEIETMTDWLTQWGEEIPETMRDHANSGHGDSPSESMEGMQEMDDMEGMDHDMPGMMSAEDMTALEKAKDAEFQDMWLEMMIDHHEGAVEMAETELDDGRYRPARDLAQDIVDSQSEEMDSMQDLIGS